MPDQSKKQKGRGGRRFEPLWERRAKAKSLQMKQAPEAVQAPTQEVTTTSHPKAFRGLSRKGVLIGATVGGVGGAAYLTHRAQQRRRRNSVAKLYDPFAEEFVEVEKGLRSNFRATMEGARYARSLSQPERKIYRRAGLRGRMRDTKGMAVHAATTVAGGELGGRVARAAARRHGVPEHLAGRWEKNGRTVGTMIGATPGAFRSGASTARAGREAVERSRVGKAAYPVAWPPPSSIGLKARTPQGRFVSHANDPTIVHYHPKRNPASKLVQIKHGPRSVSGSSVGKSLGSGAVRIGTRMSGS